MSRHVSKADEATSWRRSTALPAEHHHSTAAAGGYQQHGASHHHRSQSAEPTVHAASRQHHHTPMQPLEPIKAVPASFSPDEAQQLLDKRWAEVTAQGLQPTCQCSSSISSQGDEAASPPAAADGGSKEGGSAAGAGCSSKPSSNFLEQLAAAVKVSSADGAWDE